MTYTIQKRLRDSGCLDFALVDEAADHIDELEAEIKRLRSELLAAERIEYNDWTPSKGGRLG